MRFKKLTLIATSLSIAGLGSLNLAQAATEIRVAYGNQPGEPVDVAVKEWAKDVAKASDGELTLKAFPASQLGGETEVMEQARFGSPLITITAYSNFVSSVPDLAVLDAPYLADDFDSKLKVFDSDWFAEQEKKVEEAGYHIVIPNTVYGVRHLLSREAVSTPADLSGVKVRVQNSPMYVAAIRAMGAVPTPMSLGDVYPALAQGLVDGVENPLPVLYGGKFYEVVKHLNLTAHMHTVAPFITGEAFWQQLSPEEQQILTETGQEMADNLRTLVENETEKSLQQLKDAGVQVHEVDTAPFRERAQEEIPAAFPQWSDGLYQRVSKIING
ncbi:tripartite ATP-independent transporter DctP family solute receptor [Chromohalobacter marismortui]|uniref:Tripartite ATP-independent transporter DctP family solute receptor n=1 Tax=Chromohalobacter marismortui TaxID=42055 RepID=A0A4R7NWW6_9GAMM|nr:MULTISPECIES: C4-dicarboxylate TRAP transporter substrate-binding protein [Chromohalobacter]MCI0511166.1 C4-dicarboxylate TRAP transporter substrate-binding protein [Chromohalobacter sp.]MCI0593598.1 C4-dicarboxylate TRAP transporter substrate-binding protein [Chromohalobacter sp.]TDU25191.1 tripartite ATP-independent transporter DctP family solute receptor [Chromohalobacter marismortui]